MKFLLVFTILSIVNVIFSTVRTILTIKGNKFVASITSAGYFSFYNIMMLLTISDFPMYQKCIITFVCNFIGVYVVKVFEERKQRERLWKIELTIKSEYIKDLVADLKKEKISYNYIQNLNQKTLFNIYSSTKIESKKIEDLTKKYNAKFFISESKNFS